MLWYTFSAAYAFHARPAVISAWTGIPSRAKIRRIPCMTYLVLLRARCQNIFALNFLLYNVIFSAYIRSQIIFSIRFQIISFKPNYFRCSKLFSLNLRPARIVDALAALHVNNTSPVDNTIRCTKFFQYIFHGSLPIPTVLRVRESAYVTEIHSREEEYTE